VSSGLLYLGGLQFILRVAVLQRHLRFDLPEDLHAKQRLHGPTLLQVRVDPNRNAGDARVYSRTNLQGNTLFVLVVRVLQWFVQHLPRL